MELKEAKQILNENGYLLETEDKGIEISNFLKSHGFKHKPHSIFGLYKPIKKTPYEFFAMFGMGNCNITVSYWDWDKNKRVAIDKIDVKYNSDPNTFEKIEDFIERNNMKLSEAKQILNDNGYEVKLNEASKYDYEYNLLRNEYFPDAKDIDIHANRSIRSPLWKTLYGWECEFYLNGKRHWFTFGRGGCGFEPSLQAYIRKYCKLESFNDYKELKEEYPEASLEDIREIAKMG